jgi:hypothetical protein
MFYGIINGLRESYETHNAFYGQKAELLILKAVGGGGGGVT